MSKETRMFKLMFKTISKSYPEVAEQILEELESQRKKIKLIASENYNSLPVLTAASSLTMDKYSEGCLEQQDDGSYKSKRYYAGCERTDKIEAFAMDTVKELFGAKYAFVQPSSGSDANLIAYCALKKFLNLNRKPRLLSMSVDCGGHLTHSNPLNVVNELFDVYTYGVNDEGWIDYEIVRKIAEEVDPDIILAGYSAYPRKIDFERFREIADEVKALLMCDMAHFAGLVAGKVFTDKYNPIPYCDVVTSTTQKTLRAGRGGLILTNRADLIEFINKACPMAHGGPLNNMIASKAVGFKEALSPEFEEYAKQTVFNAQAMAETFEHLGARVLTGGTDNHMLILDTFTSYGLTGRQAEQVLEDCRIIVNRQTIPNDKNGNWYTSGIRIGCPAITTLGMKAEQASYIAELIDYVLRHTKGEGKAKYKISFDDMDNVLERVEMLLLGKKFRLYPEINTNRLRKMIRRHYGRQAKKRS